LVEPKKVNSLGYKNSGFLVISGFQAHIDQPTRALPGSQPEFCAPGPFGAQPGFMPAQPAYGAPDPYAGVPPGYMPPAMQSAYAPGMQPVYGAQPGFVPPVANPAFYGAQPGAQPPAHGTGGSLYNFSNKIINFN
jgi:hypothetical protein